MEKRDRADSERDIAPLVRPEGALYVDTTGKTIEEVVDALEAGVRERLGMKEVIKTRHIGFCFGVNRAVSKVLKEAERQKEKGSIPSGRFSITRRWSRC